MICVLEQDLCSFSSMRFACHPQVVSSSKAVAGFTCYNVLAKDCSASQDQVRTRLHFLRVLTTCICHLDLDVMLNTL